MGECAKLYDMLTRVKLRLALTFKFCNPNILFVSAEQESEEFEKPVVSLKSDVTGMSITEYLNSFVLLRRL